MAKKDVKEVLNRFMKKINHISMEDKEEQERYLLEMGEKPENIQTKAVSLDMAKMGVIKKVSIGRWRASSKLDYAILGIDVEEDEEIKGFFNEYVKSGSELLLPKRYVNALSSIESKARAYLKKNSLHSPWGQFVPWNINGEVNKDLEEFREEYFNTINEIVKYWDAIQAEMEAQYRLRANNAWRELVNKHDVPPGEFVARIINRVKNKIVSKEEFGNSCYFEIISEPVPIAPSLAKAEQAKVEAIEREKQVLNEAISEEELYLKERNRKVKEMAQDAAKDMLKQTDEFMVGILRQLREIIYNTCLELLGQNQKNQKFDQRNVEKVTNMVNKIQKLNYFNDEEIVEIIEEVKAIAPKAGKGNEVSDKELKDVVEKTAIVCRADLLDLGVTPRSGRSVNIPDEIPEELRLQAKQRKPRQKQEQLDINYLVLEKTQKRGEKQKSIYKSKIASELDKEKAGVF